VKRVAPGLFLLESCAPANAYLIEGSFDLTLVDAGPPESAGNLAAELRDNGFRIQDVQRAVLTHAHPGHAGGLSPLLEEHPFRVYAHRQEIPVLTGRRGPPRALGLGGLWRDFRRGRFRPWKRLDVALPLEEGHPVRGLAQWQVLHLGGHTRGSIGLFHPARQVLLCGDALCNQGGRLSAPEAGLLESPEEAGRTLASLAGLDCDVLCCGHGPVIRGGAFRFIEGLLAAALALALAARPGLACRCDGGIASALLEDPVSAKTAVVGRLEGEAGKRFLRVSRTWAAYSPVLPFLEGTKCGLALKPGEDYLVLSENDPSFLEKRGMGMTICDSAAVRIAEAGPIVEKLAGRESSFAARSNPSWKYCAKGSDCVLEEGVCGEPSAVNKKFRECFKSWVRETAPQVDCAVRIKRARAPAVSCLRSFCDP
jgi:glyoxylase-like metal-dependent hydrolase (beta-lactamase superfamily II)